MSQLSLKKIKLGDNADTSKNFLIKTPAVADGTLTIERENGTDVLTIDASGNIRAGSACNLAGNGPAFSAIFTGTSVPAITATEMVASAETFDTHSAYNPATGRFSPQVAGYYQFNATVKLSGANVSGATVLLRKNNTGDFASEASGAGVTESYAAKSTSGLVYLNGTTDYVSVAAYLASGSTTATGNFSGFLARAA